VDFRLLGHVGPISHLPDVTANERAHERRLADVRMRDE
jgi:hypothetical protein